MKPPQDILSRRVNDILIVREIIIADQLFKSIGVKLKFESIAMGPESFGFLEYRST